MSKILVFTGKKARGKTTAANYVMKALDGKCKLQKLSFATPLKDLCIEILGLKPEQCYTTDPAAKETDTPWDWQELSYDLREKFKKYAGPVKARELLQIIGTDLFRESFCQNIWVKAAMHMTRSCDADVILFDDARFPNEIAALRNEGAIIVRMVRDMPEDNDEHPSERALDDYPLDNYKYTIGPDVDGPERVEQKVHDILVQEGLISEEWQPISV